MNKLTFLFTLFLPSLAQCYYPSFEQGSIQLCSLCECLGKKKIDCFNERSIDFLNSEPNEIDFTINARHFRSVHKKLKWLSIDLSPLYNHKLRVSLDRQAFLLMTNLEELILIRFLNLVELPNLVTSLKLKKLIVARTGVYRIDPRFCDSKKNLVELNLSYNKIESLSHAFDGCKSLSVLDVSYNRIKSLDGVFGPSLELVRIQLDKNELKELKQSDLGNLEHAIELSVALNQLERIEPTAFDKMKELTRLDLSMNKLKTLPTKSKVYFNLVYFNVDGNKDLIYFPEATHFKSLAELRVYYAYHCCPFLGREINKDIKFELEKVQEDDNETFYEIEDFIIAKPFQEDENIDQDKFISSRIQTTKCFPLPDAFMPCENLLETLFLRVSVWLVSMAGLLANTSAIVYNLFYSWAFYSSTRELNVPTYLLTNLAFADSLMSIYLSFIAVKDMSSRDKFAQSALEWQQSRGCSVAGFLGIVSALASAFCLAFITFERYYAIKNSIDSNKRINGPTAVLASILIWFISIFLASLPLTQLDLNSYESYALCLPFDTRRFGDRIYLGILNSILSSCFLFILGCYSLIFTTTLIIERRASQPIGRDGDDTRLAFNITLLVVVNLVCWAPVVVLSARALLFSSSSTTSHPVIDRAHLKLLAVFVLPFNSLANPLLYCIGRRRFRMDLITGWVNYRFRRNIRNTASINSVRSVKSCATTRTKNGSI